MPTQVKSSQVNFYLHSHTEQLILQISVLKYKEKGKIERLRRKRKISIQVPETSMRHSSVFSGRKATTISCLLS